MLAVIKPLEIGKVQSVIAKPTRIGAMVEVQLATVVIRVAERST